jgi:arylsulfatase B
VLLNRREFLGSALLAAQVRKPNIVVILADDLGYGELGCQGNPQIPTPHIDSIAENGVRFTSAYVSAPFCCPSRAGLMTGRYQTRFGHELNVTGRLNLDPNVGLPVSERTIADHMKAAGYATGIFGKWHLGADARFHPQRRGFDEFYGFLHEGHFFAPPPYRGMTTRLRVNEPPYDDNNPLLRGGTPVDEPDYLTHAITREAEAFVEKHRSRPFFLYLPYNAVHSPMQAPVDYVRRFNHMGDEQRQLFAAMLTAMDDGVGRVLGRIRSLGLEQDTLVFFLSDNGGPTAELTSGNGKLRAGKGQLYEGGIRVPFVAQWKGRIAGGQVVHDPVSSLDILPTAVDAAGGGTVRGIDGVSLLSPMTGGRGQPHDSLFWRHAGDLALRRGRWKLYRSRRPNAAFELYDLEQDIGETTDLAARRADIVNELAREWNATNAQMVPALWGPK